MTIEEKAEAFDKVMRVLEDRVALEQFFLSEGRSTDKIRADGFGVIVNLLMGHTALPDLPVSEGLDGYKRF